MTAYLRVFQIILFLLAAVPSSIPYRYHPNPVFPSELAAFAGAILLAFAACALPAREREKSTLPWASLIWFGFIVVIGLQCLLLDFDYWTERTHPAIYAAGAGISVWALDRARHVFGARPLAEALAWGLLAGALFNSGVGVTQLVHILERGGGLVFGHIGQKNMYAHYLAWGLAAAVWLAGLRRLPMALFWPLAGWLALSMAWSSSRSVFLYALAWAAMGGILLVSAQLRREWQSRRLATLLLAAVLLTVVMQFVAPYINELLQLALGASHEAPTGVDRLASNGSRRLVEWQKAWETFKANPWLGAGWGAVAYSSVALQVRPEFAQVIESVLFTHCHQSVLNLLAETGIVGTLVVVGGIAMLFWGIWRRWHDPVVLFGATIAAVSICHSMVEYPLWYYHFLGPFALALLFVRDDGPRALDLPPLAHNGALGIAAGAGLGLAVIGGAIYMKIYPIMDPSKNVETNKVNLKKLEQLRKSPLVDYYAEFALSSYVIASKADLSWKLELLRRQNNIRPYPGQLTDQAVMEAINGHMDEARLRIRQAAYAYPESFSYFYSTIARFPDNANVQALKAEVNEAARFFKLDRPELQDAP